MRGHATNCCACSDKIRLKVDKRNAKLILNYKVQMFNEQEHELQNRQAYYEIVNVIYIINSVIIGMRYLLIL